MDKANKNMLMYGGLAAGAILLFTSSKKSTVLPGVATTEPPVYNRENFIPINKNIPDWYNIMAKLFPETVNPNYRLTDQEAMTYLGNYLDLRQATSGKSNQIEIVRKHWKEQGVPEKRTFLPLAISDSTAYKPPPQGSGWFSDVLGGVVSLIPIVNAIIPAKKGAVGAIADYIPVIDDRGLELVFNGAAIIKPALVFFKNDENSENIEFALDTILKHYSGTEYGV